MSRRPLDYLLNSPVRVKRLTFSGIVKDVPLFFSVIALLIFGFFMLYSASGQSETMLFRQMFFTCMGLFLMIVIAQCNLISYRLVLIHFYWIGLALLIYVLLNPSEQSNTSRWIDLGIISFQPSELVRLILPLAVASFLTRKQIKPLIRDWFIVMLAIFICSFLIFKEPDLGTAIIVFISGCIPVFLCGFPFSIILLFLFLAVSLSPLLWKSLEPYMQSRILTLLDSESDPLGAGWNIAQSKVAIGSGGLFGKGYLSGTQSQLDFIPASHTDFIFSVIAEELGLFGILFLLILYTFILVRIFKISFNAETFFERLVSISIGFMLLTFIIINISMVVGVFPVVGVPLPLISQGGTAIAVNLISLGIVLSVKKMQVW